MNTLLFLQSRSLSSEVSDRFSDGGSFFMSLILICLLLALYFLVRGFLSLKKDMAQSKKMTRLASEVSVLGLVIGFLGSIIGMIVAFDALVEGDSINSIMLSNGLKRSFVTTVFGSVTFILPRIGIIILRALQKT